MGFPSSQLVEHGNWMLIRPYFGFMLCLELPLILAARKRMTEITRILNSIERGDSTASDRLLPLIYQELRNLAAAKLHDDATAKSLQPTVLVHEAYIRLVDNEQRQKWNSKGHFFGAAAEAMRRILVENARRKQSQKRGGDWQRLPLEHIEPESKPAQIDLFDLDEALRDLEQQWPEFAELVKLRYFAGLTIAEAAKAKSVSTATIERHWAFAKAWLFKRMNSE